MLSLRYQKTIKTMENKIEIIECYKTSDGVLHESHLEAVKSQKLLDLETNLRILFFNNIDSDSESINFCSEFIDVLIKNKYDVALLLNNAN